MMFDVYRAGRLGFVVIFGLLSLQFPPKGMAAVGDLYHCQPQHFYGIDGKGELQRFLLEKFRFRWGEGNIVFGSEGYFGNIQKKIIGDGELFESSDKNEIIRFHQGLFWYSTNLGPVAGTEMMFAVCIKAEK